MICKGDDSMFIASIASVSGKRVKKSVQRLSEVYDKVFETSKDRKKVSLAGSGIQLGDIERVKEAYQRGKVDKEMSKNIHWLCYKTFGQAIRRNSDIRKYNGFDKDDDNESKKRLALSEKMNLGSLKIICDLFNIPTTGKQKKDICIGLVNFLKCPIETGSMIFRKSALKPKTKNKKLTGQDKVLGEKNRMTSGDVNMDDEELDSLSDIDSEEIVIAKTKRLQQHAVAMEDVEIKFAPDFEMVDVAEVKVINNEHGDTKDNINSDKESSVKMAIGEEILYVDQSEMRNDGVDDEKDVKFKEKIVKEKDLAKELNETKERVQGEKTVKTKERVQGEKAVKTKEGVDGEKVVKTKERVQGEKTVKTKEGVQGEKVVKTKERVHGEKAVKTKEGVDGEKVVKTKERVHGEKAVKTKERVQGEKTVKTKERMHGEKAVKTKERVHDEKKVKRKRKINDVQNITSKDKVDSGNMVTIKNVMVEDDMSAKYDLSDANMKVKIAEILKSADINSTTLNQVCDNVTALFPSVDLVSQRQHIKQLIKKVIDES